MARKTRKPPTKNRPAAQPRALDAAGRLQWPTATAVAVLLAAALLAYAYSFSGPFVFDGSQLIAEGSRLSTFWSSWRSMTDTARPVADLTFAVNYAIGGKSPWGYHAVNLAIHVAAALALFGIVRRTLASPRLAARFASAAWRMALAVALLWMLHPLQTQSVTYIYQRFESLMGLFVLLTLYTFIRAQDSLRPAWWHLAAVACCLLAVLTKEVAAVVPLLVLWYDRVFVASSWGEIFRRRWALYAGLAGTWAVLAVVMHSHGSQYSGAGVLAVTSVTPQQYALSQPGVIAHYLRLCFWPTGLCTDYNWPVADAAAKIVPPMLLVAALLSLTAWSTFRRPAWGFLGGWFFLILAPTSSIAPLKDLAFEHRMYLSLAAVVTAVVVGGYLGCQELVRRERLSRSTANRLTGAAVVTVALVLGVLTSFRNMDYRSDLAILEDTLAKAPHNARAESNLGLELANQNRYKEAIPHYWKAISFEPDFLAEVYQNLGSALLKLNQLDDAIAQFHAGLEIEPNNLRILTNLGNALVRRGHCDEAAVYCRQVLAVRSDHAEANTNLGIALFDQGQLDEAVRCYQRALAVKSNHKAAVDNLRSAMEQRQRADSAVEEYRKSLAVNSNELNLRREYIGALLASGRLDDAIAQLRELAQLEPDSAATHAKLAAASAQRGLLDDAIAEYQKALKLEPENAEIHYALGRVLAGRHQTREAAAERQTATSIYGSLGSRLAAQGGFAEAIRCYRRALEIQPDLAAIRNNLAWLLATCPDDSLRNGPEAIQLAKKVDRAFGGKERGALDTLAAAYAETGQFAEAIATARKALEMALQQKDEAMATELRARVALYEAGKPFRQPVPAAAPPNH